MSLTCSFCSGEIKTSRSDDNKTSVCGRCFTMEYVDGIFVPVYVNTTPIQIALHFKRVLTVVTSNAVKHALEEYNKQIQSKNTQNTSV